jgi:hypothetical protein
LIRKNGGKEVKAALFDMDGVLCDTQQYHHSCYVDIAKEYYGVTLDSNISNKLKGVLRYEGAKIFCKAVNIKANDENIKYVSDLKNKLYLKKVEENKDTLLCDGAISLLEKLKTNNIKMALASASSNAKFIFDTEVIFASIKPENKVSKKRKEKFEYYTFKINRTLSSTQVKISMDTDQDIIDLVTVK